MSGLSGSSSSSTEVGAEPAEGGGHGVRQEDGGRSALALGWARCPVSHSALQIGDLWAVTQLRKILALMWSH